jgi:hypothetical protein
VHKIPRVIPGLTRNPSCKEKSPGSFNQGRRAKGELGSPLLLSRTHRATHQGVGTTICLFSFPDRSIGDGSEVVRDGAEDVAVVAVRIGVQRDLVASDHDALYVETVDANCIGVETCFHSRFCSAFHGVHPIRSEAASASSAVRGLVVDVIGHGDIVLQEQALVAVGGDGVDARQVDIVRALVIGAVGGLVAIDEDVHEAQRLGDHQGRVHLVGVRVGVRVCICVGVGIAFRVAGVVGSTAHAHSAKGEEQGEQEEVEVPFHDLPRVCSAL